MRPSVFWKSSIRAFYAIVLWWCAASASDDTLTVRMKVYRAQKPDSVGIVRLVYRDSVKYCALQDIAKFLSARTFENPILKKTEIYFGTARVKFTAGNPFIVILRPSRTDVVQFPSSAVLEEGTLFIPAGLFPSLLDSISDIPISFEEPRAETVALEPPGKPVISSVEIEEKKNGYMLRLHANKKIRDFEKNLTGKWLYVTLPETQGDTASLPKEFTSGVVQKIRAYQTATALQLSFQFRDLVRQADIVQDVTSSDILLTLRVPEEQPIVKTPVAVPAEVPAEQKAAVDSSNVKKEETPALAAAVPEKTETKREEPVTVKEPESVPSAEKKLPKPTYTDLDKQRKKWKLDVVVIDAGHGGHDPGTLGIIGTREKDITLGIALKLGSLIEKQMPGVKVVYTRKTDRFVELYRRGQIANEIGGKLFISIHANAVERKPSGINGFEIYLLRPGKTEDAIRIAEKENAVVKLEKDYEERYQELTEENFIILTMAQSAYVRQSENFAGLLEEEMGKKFDSQSRAVKQAGFFVLVGASMPNVLIETGYLSNKKDEKLLRSPGGQLQVAESIFAALQRFKTEYDNSLQD